MSEKRRMQSDIAHARGLGSAKDGVPHWIAQRVTAIALLPLVIWIVYSFLQMAGSGHEEFVGWLSQPVNAVLMILFIIAAFYHSVLGNQVIIEDYIHHEGFKIFKLVGQKLFFTALGMACIFSILKIAL